MSYSSLRGQVGQFRMMTSTISLAAKEPAAASTAQPMPQAVQVGRGAATSAGSNVLTAEGRNIVKGAVGQGAAHAKAGFIEVRQYVQENHCSVKALSFSIALALLVFSILGLANVFDAVFRPSQYLFAFYNIIFAGMIVILEGKTEWFPTLQNRLFSNAAFLATQSGRALAYLFVGSINLFVLPEAWLWKVIYVGMGSALCFNALLMLLDAWSCRNHQKLPEEVMSEC